MEILSFGLGLFAIMVAGLALAIGIITYHRYRRAWQLLYLICAAAWVVDIGSHYLGWFAFEMSGFVFWDATSFTWLDLVLIPFDLFLMPIWLVMLVRRTVQRTLVVALLANVIAIVILLFVLANRFAVEGHEATAFDIVVVVLLFLQSYGIYLASLTYAFFGLRNRSVSAQRRDFRFVVLILVASTIIGYVADVIAENGASAGGYNPRLELPIFALVGFGFIGYRQARRLFQETSGDLGAGDVVDNAFFAEYGLSPRERDVALSLRAEGRTKDIAERLFVSESTINSHIRNIYRKCDVHSRVELVSLMRRYERLPKTVIGAR